MKNEDNCNEIRKMVYILTKLWEAYTEFRKTKKVYKRKHTKEHQV